MIFLYSYVGWGESMSPSRTSAKLSEEKQLVFPLKLIETQSKQQIF